MAQKWLESDKHAPWEARRFTWSVLGGCPDELRSRACHVVSELVTNSVRYGRGAQIEVALQAQENGCVDMDVRDDGCGFDVGPKAAGHADNDGWGLLLVDMLSESWAPGGKNSPCVHVHFEPRSLDNGPPVVEPLLETRVRDLLDVRMLLDSVKDYGIVGLDRDGAITLWNSGGERLTGYAQDEILGASLSTLHADSDTEADLLAALARGRHELEGWIVRKDKSRFWADSIITPIFGAGGALRGFSMVTRDVTWRKNLDDDRDELMVRVRHLARTDDLTDLPNRRRWHEELDRELARARRHRTPLAVAMVDLDGFKRYNDSYGHARGDRLLQRTARAWSQAIRTTDTLARYGGDEFSVILPECPIEEALVVVERIRAATPSPVTCSAGITYSDGSESAESLIRRADDALYRAKRGGRDSTVV